MRYKISIIIPIYNVAPYLERCLKSLSVQSCIKDLEFIFVEDGSTDNSYQILNSSIERFSFIRDNIKIIRNAKNLGVAYSRKIGVLNATADYIGSCDPDDWVEANMYEKLFQATENGKNDIVVCNYWRETNISTEVKFNPSSTPQDSLKNSWKLNYFPVGFPFQIIRKQLLLKSFSVLWPTLHGEDNYTQRLVYYYAKNIQFIPDVLYHYDKTVSTSITHSTLYTKQEFSKHVKNINIIENITGG